MQPNPGMRQRALSVLRNELPQRLPFITRLEAWYKSHVRRETLPAAFHGMTLDQVHAAVGIGRLKFSAPFAVRLRGVEVRATFNGEPSLAAFEPVVENFPGLWDLIPTDRAGETITELLTPRGRLTLRHKLLPEGVETGTDPYLVQHLIQSDEDFATAQYILQRLEIVPLHDQIKKDEAQLGENGLVVPLLYRIPFQQVLLEYLGEIRLFQGLHDRPALVRRLFDVLDEQMMAQLHAIADLDVPYVEFPDNLHGPMTSPRLFRDFCLPAYQNYSVVLHAQGKAVGSHTDGNLRPLLNLLPESGLDICESFSPYPLTPCSFDEAWQAFEHGPRIWGGIPSPILEDRYSAGEFRKYVAKLFARLDRPIILGIVDLFMHHNSIERARLIASWVEAGQVPELEEARSEV